MAMRSVVDRRSPITLVEWKNNTPESMTVQKLKFVPARLHLAVVYAW